MSEHENKSIHPTSPDRHAKSARPVNSGDILAGIVVVACGAVLLADKVGADLPEWLTTWPMIIVAAGLFFGAKESFRDWGWLIPVAVGLVLLANRTIGISFHQLWPVILIIAGLSMILNSGKKNKQCW